MNKAEIRFKKMEVVKNIYGYVEEQENYTRNWQREYKRELKDAIETNPEADTEYTQKRIEELEIEIDTFEKIKEQLLKLM